MKRVLTALAATLPFAANAADAITGEVQRQLSARGKVLAPLPSCATGPTAQIDASAKQGHYPAFGEGSGHDSMMEISRFSH